MTPEPAAWHRIFALTWLMCRAFARNRMMAMLAYPLGFLILIPYAVRGHLYETKDRHGMVVFGPYSMRKDAAILIAVLLPLYVLAYWSQIVWNPVIVLLVLIALVMVLVAGLLVFGSTSMGVPVGRETPKGDRYQIAALAQRPGTRLSALQLGLQLRDSLPAGAVLVAAADNDRLLRGYTRLGFTHGSGRRVYWKTGWS